MGTSGSNPGRMPRKALGGESGFTLIEVLVAMVVLATGVLALAGTIDTARGLIGHAEKNQSAAHVAEQEIERIEALAYDSIGLSSAPAHSSDPRNPDHWVQPGSPPAYRWNHRQDAPAGHTEPLAIDAGAALTSAPTPWSDGRLSGEIYRYVTWVDDSACGSTPSTLCPGAEDYKRVTVAVTVRSDGARGPKDPIVISSIVTDPDAGAADGVVDGEVNPLLDPLTKCLDASGQVVECVSTIGGADALSWFLYDTPATRSSRQEIGGDHTTHPTVAPVDTCNLLLQLGCPVPDLLGDAPPPAPSVLPPLFKYSTDVTGGYPGGRVIRRDSTCSGTPTSSDNTKGAFFVTAPFSQATTLSGAGSLTLHTQTVDSATASVTLCIRFYDVPGSIDNLISLPPTVLGTASYASSSWPTTPTSVSPTFDFNGSGSVTIPANRRLGVRIWPASGSGADIAAIYDHPSFPSSIQLNTGS